MIELKVKGVSIEEGYPLHKVTFSVPQNEALNDLNKLVDKTLDGYTLTLKKKRNKSLNANAYMWVLCRKIAKRIRLTEDDVYRTAIRYCGVYNEGAFKLEDMEDIIKTWELNGIGWFAEKYHSTDTVAVIRFYKGSSIYTGEQMRDLIDYVVEEAKALGIETMTPDELEKLKQMWGGG